MTKKEGDLKYHEMKILIMLLKHLKFNLDGLIWGRIKVIGCKDEMKFLNDSHTLFSEVSS